MSNLVSFAPPPAAGNQREIKLDLACLALLFGLLYFFQLGDTTLVNPDEGRYAEIPREMVASGDYVLPRLNGVLYFEKPPLMYWSVAGFMNIFGPDEFAMRAPDGGGSIDNKMIRNGSPGVRYSEPRGYGY